MSKYIVSIGKNKQECIELINNGDIEINKTEIILDFLIQEDRFIKTILINEIKNKQIKFEYSFKDDENLIEIIYNLEQFFIHFDNQSKSAYESFKNDLNRINKITGILYYESGNIKMTGEFTKDEESGRFSANGDAVVYYDNTQTNIKYRGEIENENYDGSGIFFNEKGNISLKINNIDQNLPVGKGQIKIIDYRGNIFYEKEINFDELDDIDLMSFDLDKFIIHYRKINNGIFKDLLCYKDFMDQYKIDENIDNQYREIVKLTHKKQNELIYKKQLEFEIKMNDLIGKINFIFDKLNEDKKTGFLW